MIRVRKGREGREGRDLVEGRKGGMWWKEGRKEGRKEGSDRYDPGKEGKVREEREGREERKGKEERKEERKEGRGGVGWKEGRNEGMG